MTKWQKFKTWLGKYWKVILGVLGAIAGVIAVLVFRKQSKALERAETALGIAENEKDIARLEGKREAFRERLRGVDERMAAIDGRLEDETKQLNKRKAAVDDMTLEEKAKRFKELGY